MSSKIDRLILPFVTSSPNRKETFPKEVERAAIICLAELERGKGGGIIKKSNPEKLVFLSEIGYAFWIAPIGELTLVFDGLGNISHSVGYQDVPDIQTFVGNLKSSSKTRQAYRNFLSDHSSYFQCQSNDVEKNIDGLIANPEFLHEFATYLSEANPVKSSLSDIVLISPSFDESTISATMHELEKLKSKFEKEAETLYESMKLLNAKNDLFIKAIREEMLGVQGEFDEKIEKIKASIDVKTDAIRREYDEKVTKLSEKVDEELLGLQKEKIKLEKSKDQASREIDRCELEVKKCAIEKDNVSEKRWKEDREKIKKELSEIETQLREVDKRISETEEKRKLEIFELKSERDAKVKEASLGLLEIESSRDARIRILQEEMEKFEESNSSIIAQIDYLAKLRETSIAGFEKLGILQKREEHALVYMPFYLACYKNESKSRYAYFSPSIVNVASLSAKLKGRLGRMKIKQLLQPRSKKMASILNKFLLSMEQNAVFNREINEACTKANLAHPSKLTISLKIGLEKLKEEGWFSEKEFESFNKLLG